MNKDVDSNSWFVRLKQFLQVEPQNKDAREKYQITLKEHKEREFAKCIQTEDERIIVNLEDIVVEEGYFGPRLDSAD